MSFESLLVNDGDSEYKGIVGYMMKWSDGI